MSTTQRQATVRDLVEEAKKRIVVLMICVVGLSYLLSLTSSSVWMNLPAAASVIIILRYLSLDYDMRRKAATYNSKPILANAQPEYRPVECSKAVDKSGWRRKINSFVVEDAIDHFTRHLVSEWVTNLWYSRLTPDKEGPEELVLIINGILGEFSSRMRNVNLISLLTRDLVSLICAHLDLFRLNQAKIQQKNLGSLTFERRDMELKVVLAAENKLHPALFSAEAEHKVLQHLMDGLMSSIFRHEDLQCSFFRITVRELLACAVIRPVLNLASPRFINERIESAVISRTKINGVAKDQFSHSDLNEYTMITSDQISRYPDPSVSGVELVRLKSDQTQTAAKMHSTEKEKQTDVSKEPLLSLDARTSRSWSSLPSDSPTDNGEGLRRHNSGGEWGEMLDLISQRRTQALAPEHFENMWAKGRNYRKKDGESWLNEQVPKRPSSGRSVIVTSKPKEDGMIKVNYSTHKSIKSDRSDISSREGSLYHINQNTLNGASDTSFLDESEDDMVQPDEDFNTSSSTSEDEDTSNVTGLDSPGTKVWDGKSNRNLAASHIHHPLESCKGHKSKKTKCQKLLKNLSGGKKPRGTSQKLPVWQEVERTSFISGAGQDILSSLKEHANLEDSTDDSETEIMGRIKSGATASSSASYMSIPESHHLTVNPVQSSLLVDSFFKLRCEVLGANIVRSGSKTFAVYSISVTDVNNNCWSIKRRYSHFEELHRRLKVFPEYKLHLPPKHFLSTGLEPLMIQERCELLDGYLKKLLQLPRISGSIEVWDFLSVDSQTYIFSNSFSIIETLSVDLTGKQSDKGKRVSEHVGSTVDPLPSDKVHVMDHKDFAQQLKHTPGASGLGLNSKGTIQAPVKISGKECSNSVGNSRSDPDARIQKSQLPTGNLEKFIKEKENDGLNDKSKLPLDAATDPTLPTEWVPPNLSMPILDLVDVIFQLQDGGWIRRKAFWVAKQILQLGMGDAFDDWLIEKIQLLRKGTVIAAGIKRVEEILWPDGIFITKHPKRQSSSAAKSPQCSPQKQQPTDVSSPSSNDEQQQQEGERSAKFVYELMIDKAPAALVGLFGRKEYEQCAKDLYFFLQSSVCLKQLAFDLLELLLLSAFPELDPVFKKLHGEKHRFGEFKAN